MENEKIKNAYSVMGLKEGADRKEIEYKYFLITKRHLILQRENVKSQVVGLNMEKINEAYLTLININSKNLNYGTQNQEIRQKLVPFFIENYKGPIIVAIILIFLFASAIITVNKESNKINVVWFGEFNSENIQMDDFDSVYDNEDDTFYEENMDENVQFKRFLLLDNLELPFKINMMTEAYKFITEGNYHILIMDKKSFEEYACFANIAQLDEIVKELEIDKSSFLKLKKIFVDEEEHIYGLKSDYISNGYNLADEETTYIIAIRDGLSPETNKAVIETVKRFIE